MRPVHYLHNTIHFMQKNQYNHSDYCSISSYYDVCLV